MSIDLSNLASDDTSTNRISQGSLFPCLILITSPGTSSTADITTVAESLTAVQSSGSIVVIEAMTLEDDQSCQALKPAWMKKTANNTIASARFARAGGSPRGFQAIKTRMHPVKSSIPNPPKKYPMILRNHSVRGRVGAFLPCSSIPFRAWSAERPWETEVFRPDTMLSMGIKCQSSSEMPVVALKGQLDDALYTVSQDGKKQHDLTIDSLCGTFERRLLCLLDGLFNVVRTIDRGK